jgi:hypothetical protein
MGCVVNQDSKNEGQYEENKNEEVSCGVGVVWIGDGAVVGVLGTEDR